MENKERKKPIPMELDEEALERVGGGLKVLMAVTLEQTCAGCGAVHSVTANKHDREYYCDACKAKMS